MQQPLDKRDQPHYFGTTQWTVVLQAKELDHPANDEAMQRLCRTYWYPLYSFARRKGNNPEDAQDLVQGFFERFLAKHYLRSVEKDRGKFRTFLLTSFTNYMANEYEKLMAQKRGGHCSTFSIDAASAEDRFQHEPAVGVAPDRAYDREWAQTVFDLVLERLESEYGKADLEQRFKALSIFLMGDEGGQTYEQVGPALGLSEGGVKTFVRRMRIRFRELLRDELRQTLEDPDEADAEMRELLLALG